MNGSFDILDDQIRLSRQLLYHFYPGVLITLFYVVVSPIVVNAGYSSLVALLLAEVLVLAPIGMGHMLIHGRKLHRGFTLRDVVVLSGKLTLKQYIIWSLLGFAACVAVYVPFYPAGLFLREQVFSWLPEWYFNPSFGTEDVQLLAKVFLAAILIDGLVGPIVEELYFRGYLLPRMAFLNNWAPILNGALFGLYHFWQPHNYLAITAIGIMLSYIVWKKKNVYLGILIHCSINVIGAISGYLAVSSGVAIGR